MFHVKHSAESRSRVPVRRFLGAVTTAPAFSRPKQIGSPAPRRA